MKIRPLLGRFSLKKTDEPKADVRQSFGRDAQLIQKAEIKALFRSVLEEKRDDLPSRRQ